MVRPPLSLKARALACIAQREHSRVELRRKLLAHVDRQRRASANSPLTADAPPPAWPSEREIDELLDWLASKDLLSAERFVEVRVGARLARFGNQRIRQELARHGVEVDAATAQELKASELPRARAVWAKRFGEPAVDAAGRARQARFLSARGFSAEVVWRVVGGRADD
jgi:regulatory protein